MEYSVRRFAKTTDGGCWRSSHRKPQTKSPATVQFITNQLDAKPGQVHVNPCGARAFLDERFSVEELADLFPEEEDLIEELGDSPVS